MKYEVKKVKETVKEVTIDLDKNEAQAAYNAMVKEIAKVAEIKGFRKGKAPESVIIEKYEGDIKAEVAEKIMKDHYYDILTKEKINPLDNPKLVSMDITKEKAQLKLEIEVLPEVKVANYKGLTAEKETYSFKEETLTAEIEGLASKLGKIKEVEAAEKAKDGDVVNIDFEGFVDGVAFNGGKAEGYELKLGTHSFVDTFEDQIVGHVKGDEFDVVVTFPENYQADLAGKKATFKVKVNGIKRVEIPAIDDNLAKELGYDNLAELKKDKTEEIEKREKERIEGEFINKLLTQIKDETKFDVPEALIKRETEMRLNQIEQDLKAQGISMDMYLNIIKSSKEKMVEELRGSVIEKVKLDIILEQISVLEKVEATDEEINTRMEEVAKIYGMDLATLTANLKKANRYDVFLDNIKIDKIIQKTIDKIVAEAKVK